MLKPKQPRLHSLQKGGLFLIVACSLSGCSTLQSWFPDKEKDYQFTTELPPLIIPQDLIQKPVTPSRAAPVEFSAPKIAKVIEPAAIQPKSAMKIVEAAAPEPKAVNRPTLNAAETELSRHEIQVSVTHENAPTLNLNVPSVRAWRIVGKALSRSGIEVVNRNQDSGQIQIQVADSAPKKEQEKSFFDDTFAVFDGFVSNEQSYILQFHEANSKTTVTVLNPELQPITDGADNKLLMILFEAIKADLSK